MPRRRDRDDRDRRDAEGRWRDDRSRADRYDRYDRYGPSPYGPPVGPPARTRRRLRRAAADPGAGATDPVSARSILEKAGRGIPSPEWERVEAIEDRALLGSGSSASVKLRSSTVQELRQPEPTLTPGLSLTLQHTGQARIAWRGRRAFFRIVDPKIHLSPTRCRIQAPTLRGEPAPASPPSASCCRACRSPAAPSCRSRASARPCGSRADLRMGDGGAVHRAGDRVATGREAARICALNLLASLSLASTRPRPVVRCHRLGGSCRWSRAPRRAEGRQRASDLMAELFARPASRPHGDRRRQPAGRCKRRGRWNFRGALT